MRYVRQRWKHVLLFQADYHVSRVIRDKGPSKNFVMAACPKTGTQVWNQDLPQMKSTKPAACKPTPMVGGSDGENHYNQAFKAWGRAA